MQSHPAGTSVNSVWFGGGGRSENSDIVLTMLAYGKNCIFVNNQLIDPKIVLHNYILYKGHPNDVWIIHAHLGMTLTNIDFLITCGKDPNLEENLGISKPSFSVIEKFKHHLVVLSHKI